MRIKKIAKQQYIALRLDEATALKELLYRLSEMTDDFYDYGIQEESVRARDLGDELDDLIIKADAK